VGKFGRFSSQIEPALLTIHAIKRNGSFGQPLGEWKKELAKT
jgi:hypothetical protein